MSIDYPVAAPDDIDPIIFRAMLIQAMAFEYFNAMQSSPDDFGLDEAFEAAHATWATDWDDDPVPRTLEAALEAVRGDLPYWAED